MLSWAEGPRQQQRWMNQDLADFQQKASQRPLKRSEEWK